MTGRLADKTAASMHKALDVAIIQELGSRLAADAALSGEAHSLASFIAAQRRSAMATASALIIGSVACLGSGGDKRPRTKTMKAFEALNPAIKFPAY